MAEPAERRRPVSRRRPAATVLAVSLLFVRSTGGSHNPGEAVRENDVAAAIGAATRFACSI